MSGEDYRVGLSGSNLIVNFGVHDADVTLDLHTLHESQSLL